MTTCGSNTRRMVAACRVAIVNQVSHYVYFSNAVIVPVESLQMANDLYGADQRGIAQPLASHRAIFL